LKRKEGRGQRRKDIDEEKIEGINKKRKYY